MFNLSFELRGSLDIYSDIKAVDKLKGFSGPQIKNKTEIESKLQVLN